MAVTGVMGGQVQTLRVVTVAMAEIIAAAVMGTAVGTIMALAMAQMTVMVVMVVRN
ncbi:hypothetical protein [Dickeya poaceiphila]|nr:hypothetical protein [Dickeya poaceiphila]